MIFATIKESRKGALEALAALLGPRSKANPLRHRWHIYYTVLRIKENEFLRLGM